MKYVILIGDGMADYPIDSLGGKTPLEFAPTPNLDSLAGSGTFGLFATVPPGYPPGSDVANLSILGYDPAKYYSGRSPLEAASIGVKLSPTDVAFRCNLVTLADKGGSVIMDDYSSGHISTEEADCIIKSLDKGLRGEGVRFYTGTSYRHLMVWENGPDKLKTTPPHDISDKDIAGHLPKGNGADKIARLMALSQDVMKDHPVNRKRVEAGWKPATSIWLWGQGKAPAMPTMKERFGIDGAIISAVDLMKGIGIYAGLEVLKVPGVTGYIDTNYRGKAEHALAALETKAFVCVHVEAPDEAGHNGNLKDKLKAIEDFDREVVGRVLKGLTRFAEYRVLALTDHPTPIALKTHTSDPVPFALYTGGVNAQQCGSAFFSEREAGESGLLVDDCKAFMEEFFGRPEGVCDIR
ncbi:MAG: cofactor-independent phosphoglycerate mutase [Deltaproteobacteria bacterium]|nr:cofactor-independent phosphoglycerate mutase [Deltaproteobacteria bacterium]